MTREWKPGDVALVEAGCWANQKVAIRRSEGWSHANGTNLDNDGVVTAVRPLVVLDPEDREQVERLLSDYHQWKWATEGSAASINDMQAALRSLVAPPKPDEPKGLGAVVEDEHGEKWVLFSLKEFEGRGWASASGRVETNRAWREVAAVRVLSEGVA